PEAQPVPRERDDPRGHAGDRHRAPAPPAIAGRGEGELGTERLHEAGDDEDRPGRRAEQHLGERRERLREKGRTRAADDVSTEQPAHEPETEEQLLTELRADADEDRLDPEVRAEPRPVDRTEDHREDGQQAIVLRAPGALVGRRAREDRADRRDREARDREIHADTDTYEVAAP